MAKIELNKHLSEKARYDYDLVVRATKKKDQRAFAKLMERYRDSVYFMLMKMVNNKDDADDLTIEAFGKAFRRLDQYTPDFAFSTWLFKIANNNCIDFIRKKKMTLYSIDQPVVDEEGGERTIELESQTLNPADNMIKNEKISLMQHMVKKLKPRYRQLVELRYFSEYSYEEIAEKLDLPVGTVKAQLFRARDLLYEVLKQTKDTI